MTTILVVDDEFLIADLLVYALEEVGFRVLQAPHGRKALELYERELPALIVTDFMMPLMTGLELAEAIKARNGNADFPIILVSGAQGLIARDRPDLFAAVYDKPFRIADIVDKVVELVGQTR